MLSKGKLDNGFNTQAAPIIPRAPRSIRVKRVHDQAIKDGPICAFELLATVAGKLLQESESSSASSSAAVGLGRRGIGIDTIKKEVLDVHKSFGEHDEQGSSEESIFFSGLCSKNNNKKETDNSLPEMVGQAIVQPATIVHSACSVKVDSDVESAVRKRECQLVKLPSTLEGGSPNFGESYYTNQDTNSQRGNDVTGIVNGAKDVDEFYMKSSASGHSNKNVDLMLQNSGPATASFLQLQNDVNIGKTDDDEIFSLSSLPYAKKKALVSPTCSGDQRVRKILASRNWKVAPKLKDSEFVNIGRKAKHAHRVRKSCYEHGRFQSYSPFKKRKLFDQSSTVTYDRGNSSESVSNSPEDIDINKGTWAAILHPGTAATSSFKGHQKSPCSTSSNVKFTIKSFKVPELLLEVPESTTVGSFKKTVLDSVTQMLGGGLRVGVVLRGKKLRDDNRTLLEAGITCNGYLDTLGFLLEPTSPTQRSPPLFTEIPIPQACDSQRNPIHRSQLTCTEDLLLSHTTDKLLAANSGSCDNNNQDLAPALFSVKEMDFDSTALMPVPETIVEPLAVVPVTQRPSRSDIGQRRTRRPFSVTEVEALVAAVEKLGTGRWRDIKLSAFENAKHRTYVDLKDKWKTLVHTARISPQQRRGEPVPQELLDRVLAAHACWSQNQTKEQPQHGIINITEVLSHY